MENILVSIIIPVYNVEQYLELCISSIVNQSYTNLEIICINDGSTDTSGQILDKWEKNDKRIKVIHKENTGYGDSVNYGIDIAKGTYLFVIESDDFVERCMVEELLTLAEKYQTDFVKADYYMYKYGKKKKKENLALCTCNQVFGSQENMRKFTVDATIWSCIYKKDFLNKNHIRFQTTSGAAYQDIGFIFKIFVAAERGYFTSNAYVNYRLDNENASVKQKNKAFAVQKELESCYEFLKNRNQENEIFKYWLMKSRFNVYRWNLDRIAMSYVNEFVNVFSEEIKRDISQGNYDKNLFSVMEQKYIDTLISDKESIARNLLETKIEAQNMNTYMKAMIKMIETEGMVYIYGAGKIGNIVYDYVKRNCKGTRLQFVCTNKQENIEVMLPNEITEKDALIIISIANLEEQIDVYTNLQKMGFSNILIWNRVLGMKMN